MQVIRSLIEKCNEYKIPIGFIDYEKAFDSVETWSMLDIPDECRIDSKHSKTIRYGIGININGNFFNYLRFADDIILIIANQLQTMINQLHQESFKIGFKINLSKTKVMTSIDDDTTSRLDMTLSANKLRVAQGTMERIMHGTCLRDKNTN